MSIELLAGGFVALIAACILFGELLDKKGVTDAPIGASIWPGESWDSSAIDCECSTYGRRQHYQKEPRYFNEEEWAVIHG